ncbi:MAG: prepilin-type N-terminal cleavage/methylation domain-containing protein [Kiritimatiellae bacterium]|nr:prepilin-type N-terminal cleavage/methylation domain-containing protein [Kiritimatiellia bacterium]MDD5521937.1 prepilin-type N-terminal cleavage/methylation domain-containing protein [Kiritimatiellia bacterium]
MTSPTGNNRNKQQVKRKEYSFTFGKSLQDGFTLPEVLIAVAILSTGIVVVLESFNVSLSVLGEARNVLRANMLIMEKMADIELSALAKSGFDAELSNGLFGDENNNYHWESKVTGMSVLSGIGIDSATLNQVDLTVWRDGSSRRYSASTFLRVEKQQ